MPEIILISTGPLGGELTSDACGEIFDYAMAVKARKTEEKSFTFSYYAGGMLSRQFANIFKICSKNFSLSVVKLDGLEGILVKVQEYGLSDKIAELDYCSKEGEFVKLDDFLPYAAIKGFLGEVSDARSISVSMVLSRPDKIGAIFRDLKSSMLSVMLQAEETWRSYTEPVLFFVPDFCVGLPVTIDQACTIDLRFDAGGYVAGCFKDGEFVASCVSG